MRRLLPFILLLASSCVTDEIIFEDRKDCPCYVQVDFSGIVSDVRHADLWFCNEKGQYDYYKRFNAPFPDTLYVPVRKGMTSAYLWGNIQNSTIHDIERTLLFGHNVELLYYWSETIDAKTENTSVHPVVKRRGCPIEVSVSTRADIEDIAVIIRSGCNGYSYNGIPIKTPFINPLTHITAKKTDTYEKIFKGVIPYQPLAEDLGLDLAFMYDGNLRHISFDLGKHLSLMNIDLESSEQIKVRIEVSEITATDIKIIPYIEIYDYNIEI